MFVFNADPRDSSSALNQGCNTCCCKPATARPGERNKWTINFAGWSAPISAKLSSRVAFDLEKMEMSPDTRAPVNTNYFFSTPFNTALNGDISASAVDPLEGTLKFRLHGLYAPERGEVVVNEDGTFVYTPTLGFTGYDSFYVVTENEAKEVVTQVIVGVAANGATDPMPAKAFDPMLYVHQKTVQVSDDLLSFQLGASPAAVEGDRYRLTIRQSAVDCDCDEYFHVSCYDITIVSC